MLRPSGRVLPKGWVPPMSLTVRVCYRDGRPPDDLWVQQVMTVDDGEGGRLPVFEAYGPAGTPVGRHLIASVDVSRLPWKSRLHIATGRDGFGREVYIQPRRTLN